MTEHKMAFVCLLLSFILGMTAALPQDLSGKMLVFPKETKTDHVRLTTSRQNLGAATVCMRYFTDLTRGTTFFSLATPSRFNDFLIDKTAAANEISVAVRDAVSTFKGQGFHINKWQSICATWEAGSGLTQLWLNGKHSSLKFTSNSDISGPMIIMLGQEQDNYGGGFDSQQSFVGMISDVHMWDYVLSPRHIDNYSQKFNFPEGNVLNWRSIELDINGQVHIQKEQSCE